jgi:poly(3-hydroxybutyrate) depolymerase
MSIVTPTSPAAAPSDLTMYDLGASTIFAYAADPRFSYCTFAPANLSAAAEPPELVVIVHGTGRSFVEYRDAFAQFARWNNCIVLCPLFPAGVLGDGNRDGFKQMREGDIRYDGVLLGMVDEVGRKFGADFHKFGLFGYSGGGQYVNRFCYLHPERLWALSIGAPGSVTLIDPNQDWWVGMRNFATLFGQPFNLEALKRVPVHMIVGNADIETWEITHKEGGKFYMKGANDAGRTRPERIESLRRSFVNAGVDVTLDALNNVAHDGLSCVDSVQDFLAGALRSMRAARKR